MERKKLQRWASRSFLVLASVLTGYGFHEIIDKSFPNPPSGSVSAQEGKLDYLTQAVPFALRASCGIPKFVSPSGRSILTVSVLGEQGQPVNAGALTVLSAAEGNTIIETPDRVVFRIIRNGDRISVIANIDCTENRLGQGSFSQGVK